MISCSIFGVLVPSLEAKLWDRSLIIWKRASLANCEPKHDGVCGATNAALFFFRFPVLLVLVLLSVLSERDVDVDVDVSEGHTSSISNVFFLDITTEKSLQLQKGHVDSFSFWGLTCKKHSVHILALQHVVVLTSVYIKKQMGHSSVAPIVLSGDSCPLRRDAMRPSAINLRIAFSSHAQPPYNLMDHSVFKEIGENAGISKWRVAWQEENKFARKRIRKK